VKKVQEFGKRKEPHTVIIAQGQDIRHFTIRPWAVGITAAVFMAMAVGYLLSTSYLILRDDLLNTAVARQAKLQHAYEDRIASLRGQVDRITSHRLLDQQFMEGKIAELASRQNILASRSNRIEPLLERAKELGLSSTPASAMPVPKLRPGSNNKQARLGFSAPRKAVDTMTTGSIATEHVDELPSLTKLADVRSDLYDIERTQIEQIAALSDAAAEQRMKIVNTARKAGLPIRAIEETTGTGGPFIPTDAKDLNAVFDSEIASFNNAMQELEKTKKAVRSFPIVNPAPGKSISSKFGRRKDPIIGRSAFHGGIDFRAPTGTRINAAADGKVVKAGRNGGYGNLVEIKHANGLTTRYAHLSRVYVKVGQKVVAGQKVGAAGSTGRSTGPHLHYEVRSGGKPINPIGYLNAGSRLSDYL
jgi:murein DD-endopeptidase MepM/ murein hydrolase activator NlpD